jgi:hypothetical protein
MGQDLLKDCRPVGFLEMFARKLRGNTPALYCKRDLGGSGCSYAMNLEGVYFGKKGEPQVSKS